MKISTRGRYALRIMVDLAQNPPASQGEYIKLQEIADRQEISKEYLVQLITALKNSGLVISSSGKKGGYALARRPDEIRVLEIVESAIGPVSIIDCVNNGSKCTRSSACQAHDLWHILTMKIRDVMQSISLAQISDTAFDLYGYFDLDMMKKPCPRRNAAAGRS